MKPTSVNLRRHPAVAYFLFSLEVNASSDEGSRIFHIDRGTSRRNTARRDSATLAVSVAGQQTSESKLVFNHGALSVKDLNVSADFYRRVLNLHELSKQSRSKGVRGFPSATVPKIRKLRFASLGQFRG